MIRVWMVTLVSLTVLLQYCETAKILMITLAGTKSHKIPFMELGRGLASWGHNVTFLNAFPPEKSDPLIEEVHPKNLVAYIRNFTNWDLLGPKLRGEMPVPIADIFKFGYQVCEAFLSDEETRYTMMRPRFDLLVLDGAYPECAVGLAHHFRAPFVYLNTVGFYTGSISAGGSPAPYAVTPYLGLPYSDDMLLFQRLVNAAHHVAMASLHWIMVTFFLNRILRANIDEKMPGAYELTKNVSFILQNGHFSVTYARPYLPSVVEIACIHCRKPQPLPSHLEEFINGGSEGFIYVSMGSSVQASNMPERLQSVFMRVFSRLSFRVLMKWESDVPIRNLPRNVLLNKWFPQQDLLGHPKIKAFVTHGGLLSLYETVYHGVPALAMPVFCDHDSNVEKAVRDGYVIRLELRELTTAKLFNSLDKVVKNSKYKNAVKKRSNLLRDQMVDPLEKAVYWIEYVIRHEGAPHLQSSAKSMTFLSYYSLDVFALVFLLIYLFISIFISLIRRIFRGLFLSKLVKIKLKIS